MGENKQVIVLETKFTADIRKQTKTGKMGKNRTYARKEKKEKRKIIRKNRTYATKEKKKEKKR